MADASYIAKNFEISVAVTRTGDWRIILRWTYWKEEMWRPIWIKWDDGAELDVLLEAAHWAIEQATTEEGFERLRATWRIAT